MAIYDNLPVFKQAYDLLLQILFIIATLVLFIWQYVRVSYLVLALLTEDVYTLIALLVRKRRRTPPEEPISAPAVVTEGRVPEEYDALPTEVVSLYDWQTSGEPLALLAEIPEQEMALYGVADRDAPHVLFRWGDTLAEFPDWVIYTPKSVTPELLALDLDGDGAVEPVVSCFQGGNQVSRYALHVLQQSRGTLTDSQLPDSLYEEQLSALLTLSGSGEMLTISLGSQSIEAALPEGVQALTAAICWGIVPLVTLWVASVKNLQKNQKNA